MQIPDAFEKCRSFLDCQLQLGGPLACCQRPAGWRPGVTLTRQTGSGARTIAEKLAAFLQAHSPPSVCPWTVFDDDLVQKVLEDHHLPLRLAQYMPEDRVSKIDDMVGELLGLHPPAWTLVHQTTETILRLAELGQVILVGRGAPVITRKLEQMFHVRLVGSLARRTAHVCEFYHLPEAKAIEYIRHEDRGRARYLQDHFREEVDNPLLYHLVVNTDWVDYDQAARLIGEAVLARHPPVAKA